MTVHVISSPSLSPPPLSPSLCLLKHTLLSVFASVTSLTCRKTLHVVCARAPRLLHFFQPVCVFVCVLSRRFFFFSFSFFSLQDWSRLLPCTTSPDPDLSESWESVWGTRRRQSSGAEQRTHCFSRNSKEATKISFWKKRTRRKRTRPSTSTLPTTSQSARR